MPITFQFWHCLHSGIENSFLDKHPMFFSLCSLLVSWMALVLCHCHGRRQPILPITSYSDDCNGPGGFPGPLSKFIQVQLLPENYCCRTLPDMYWVGDWEITESTILQKIYSGNCSLPEQGKNTRNSMGWESKFWSI